MAELTLSLVADVSALEALLAELLEGRLELREAFVHGLHALGESAFATRVDLDLGAATGAMQQRIVLEPSQALLELASALRASDVDLNVVEHAGHGCPFRKVV